MESCRGLSWDPSIFINDLEDVTSALLLILKITSNWAGAVCRLKDRAAILKILVRLEEWSDRSVRELRKIKCRVLHLVRKNHA